MQETVDETVARLRARIDVLDEEIVALALRRRELSARVQDARVRAGGPRVENNRENVVIARYAAALGRPGGRLALALLEICRGVPH